MLKSCLLSLIRPIASHQQPVMQRMCRTAELTLMFVLLAVQIFKKKGFGGKYGTPEWNAKPIFIQSFEVGHTAFCLTLRQGRAAFTTSAQLHVCVGRSTHPNL